MANDIEPCPLCGKADFRIEVRERDICADPRWVDFTGKLKCRTCGLELAMRHRRIRTDGAQQLASEELARQLKERWNTRAAVPQVYAHPPFAVYNGETWRRVRECCNLSRTPGWLLCSCCGAFTKVTDASSAIHAKWCGNCGAKVVE